MPAKHIALAALLCASALPCTAAAGAAVPKDLDLQRMGWLPSEVYDVGEGLPDPTVNAIATLPNGQMWFGTMRGLARQSGARMQAEPGPDGMLSGAILDLAATDSGDLLAATDARGIWRLRDGTWSALGAPFGKLRVQRLRLFGKGKLQRVFAIGGEFDQPALFDPGHQAAGGFADAAEAAVMCAHDGIAPMGIPGHTSGARGDSATYPRERARCQRF